jgi:MraZ protein
LFRGRTSVALDSKGRMAIPTKYRDTLNDHCKGQMVVTRHPKDPCLMLYPMPEWEVKEEILNNAPSLDARTIQVQRIVIGNAIDCEMDGQGRILIPESLRSYADFKKNIALIGLVGKFEIWDSEQWDGGINQPDTDIVADLAQVPGLEGFTF